MAKKTVLELERTMGQILRMLREDDSKSISIPRLMVRTSSSRYWVSKALDELCANRGLPGGVVCRDRRDYDGAQVFRFMPHTLDAPKGWDQVEA